MAPVRSTDVALHGLSVTFEFDADREAFSVKEHFELENRAARETKLQLGLIEARCESDSDDEDPCGDPATPRIEKLKAQVAACNSELNLQLFPDEEEHVVAHLDKTYYKFTAGK